MKLSAILLSLLFAGFAFAQTGGSWFGDGWYAYEFRESGRCCRYQRQRNDADEPGQRVRK